MLYLSMKECYGCGESLMLAAVACNLGLHGECGVVPGGVLEVHPLGSNCALKHGYSAMGKLRRAIHIHVLARNYIEEAPSSRARSMLLRSRWIFACSSPVAFAKAPSSLLAFSISRLDAAVTSLWVKVRKVVQVYT
jgi:hypothetical protein